MPFSFHDSRLPDLKTWAVSILGQSDWKLSPASEDASFRRYFRISRNGESYILMDAPPEKENIEPFIDVTHKLLSAKVHAPVIHAVDQSRGFMLLDDLGSTCYLDELDIDTAKQLYADALNSLLNIQQADINKLPLYDNKLLRDEMSLFDDWFLGRHLGIVLNSEQQQLLEDTHSILSDNALEQPQVFVHRDYHSRNLMVTDANNPGIIDYQDAVHGPITYDLVSLLRDCYVAWPPEQVKSWALAYRDSLVVAGLLDQTADSEFLRWFDLMGIQRQLKAIGIFSRLNHRDGKSGYLKDIPRTLTYILQVAPDYADTHPLAQLIEELDIPRRLGL